MTRHKRERIIRATEGTSDLMRFGAFYFRRVRLGGRVPRAVWSKQACCPNDPTIASAEADPTKAGFGVTVLSAIPEKPHPN
jgi:hypothetical protein